jgi:streptomycin 3"-adenylyltransferase
MPQYDFSHVPSAIRLQVDMILSACQKGFGDILIGVYLHGSLAMGSFNPKQSDLDLLVVNQGLLVKEQRIFLSNILLNISKHPSPIEISVLRQQDLIPWQYPTPYDFHFSESWRTSLQEQLNSHRVESSTFPLPTDDDLAAHITVLHERGICLLGEPIQNVFPVVPHKDYLHSLCADFRWSAEQSNQLDVYLTLNLCRTLAYLKTGSIFSKDEGGVWAIKNLPSVYRPLIQSALRSYREKTPRSLDKAELAGLIAYAQGIIGF